MSIKFMHIAYERGCDSKTPCPNVTTHQSQWFGRGYLKEVAEWIRDIVPNPNGSRKSKFWQLGSIFIEYCFVARHFWYPASQQVDSMFP